MFSTLVAYEIYIKEDSIQNECTLIGKFMEVKVLLKSSHETTWCAFGSQKVDYPLELDVYDLCSEDLRKKLEAPRQVFAWVYWPHTKYFIHLQIANVAQISEIKGWGRQKAWS